MKNIKVGFLTLVAAIVAAGCAILQVNGIPVPDEAYGIAGGVALIGARDKKIRSAHDTKQWYESKTVWIAIMIIIASILQVCGIGVSEQWVVVLSALGIVFNNTSEKNLK